MGLLYTHNFLTLTVVVTHLTLFFEVGLHIVQNKVSFCYVLNEESILDVTMKPKIIFSPRYLCGSFVYS